MIRYALLLIALIFYLKGATAQLNNAYFNKAQKKIYNDRFVKNGIKAFVVQEYSSEKDIEKKAARSYQIVLLDSSGKEMLRARFDKEKKRLSFTQYEYDSLGQNVRELYHFNKSDSISSFSDRFFDFQGELIESVQHGKFGSINSKTINYYNSEGFLDHADVFGPDGRLTFNLSIIRNQQGYPIQTILKSVNGFVMYNMSIQYLKDDLPKESTSVIGITGKSTKWVYEFDHNDNLHLQKEYSKEKLTSIEITEYIKENVEDYLKEGGFDLMGLDRKIKVRSSDSFYFDKLATFPGGEKGLINYLRNNIVYTSKIEDQGVVIVGFAVDTVGKIVDIKVDRGLSKSLDKKAIEVVEEMPKWIPAQLTSGETHKSTVSVGVLFIKR